MHLRDVPQVGEQPLAADLAEDPRLQLLVERHRLEHRGDPAVLEHRAPDPQLQREVVGEVVAGRVQPGRVEPDEAGQRDPAYPGGAVRLLQRLEQPLPLRGGRRREDADVLPVSTTGTPAACSSVCTSCGLAVGSAPAPRCRRAAPAAASVPSRGCTDASPDEQRHDLGRPGRGRQRRAPVRSAACRLPVTGSAVARHDPQLQRHRRRHQPPVVRGLDRQHPDPLVAERCAAEDRGHPVEQRRVAAVVGRQRAHHGRRRARLEVGVHVGAAEAVDGLLRVADQHQGAVAVERLAQDRPLHRVGVLELVDQHHPVARPQPSLRDRTRRRVGEGVPEPEQHVVVVDELLAPLAPVDLGAHRGGDPGPLPGHAVGRRRRAAGRWPGRSPQPSPASWNSAWVMSAGAEPAAPHLRR